MDDLANQDQRVADESGGLEGTGPVEVLEGERLEELDAELPEGAEFELDESDGAASDAGGDSEPILEGVIRTDGTGDERRPVPDTFKDPYNRLCQLEITTAANRSLIGTGWVIGKRMVITAGHCVYRHKERDFVKKIVLNFGMNGGSVLDRITVTRSGSGNPFNTPRRFRDADFREESTAAFDYGSILLPKRVASGVKRMGYLKYSDDKLRRGKFNVFGYPSDKGGRTLWGHAGRLTDYKGRIIGYRIDTNKGQSGCPVIHVVRIDGIRRYIAVGIHNSSSSSGRENLATRINQDVCATLDHWRNLGS